MSAEVCRRSKLAGGEDTDWRGWGGGGGGGGTCGRRELGDDCAVLAPIDPYLRGVARCDGTAGRWKLPFRGGGTTIIGARRGSSCGSWRGETGALSKERFEK